MDEVQEGKINEIEANMRMISRALKTVEAPKKNMFENEDRTVAELMMQLKQARARRNTERRRAYKFANAAYDMNQVLRDVAVLLQSIRHRMTVQEYMDLKLRLAGFGVEF